MNTIITISREHGTNAQEIAKRLAEAMGIPYYDNENMAELFKENSKDGMEYFRSSGETSGSEKLFGRINTRYLQYNTLNEEMFQEQSRVMVELAQKGSAVFVGRCADVVLQGCEGLITVFIGGSLESRIQSIIEHTGKSAKQAKAEIHTIDSSRASYYSYYAQKKWGLRESYDLCIDCDALDTEGIVQVIKCFVERKTDGISV